jgi:hypothetical protein
MATYFTSDKSYHGLIVRQGIDTDTIVVGGVNFTPVSPTFTGTTTVGGLTATGAVSMTGTVSLTNASVSMTNLPTADPHVIGRIWSNSGVMTVSAG